MTSASVLLALDCWLPLAGAHLSGFGLVLALRRLDPAAPRVQANAWVHGLSGSGDAFLRTARGILALSVVAAVVTAPTVARTRLVCRATGVEIPAEACPDEAAAPARGLIPQRCCEARVQAPLGEAKFEPGAQPDLLPPPTIVPGYQWCDAPGSQAPPVPNGPYPSRPPLSATRILLI